MLPSIEGIFSITPSHSSSTQTLIVFSAHFLNLFNLCYVVSCSLKIKILKLKVEIKVEVNLNYSALYYYYRVPILDLESYRTDHCTNYYLFCRHYFTLSSAYFAVKVFVICLLSIVFYLLLSIEPWCS